MATLLLELHCEEIPARFLRPLSEEFSAAFQTWAETERLGALAIRADFSPRKLSWVVEGLVEAQDDQTEIQVGPPQRMCVDENGAFTVQGQKFAEKWGVGVDSVRFEQPAGKKEPCAVVSLTKAGRPTVELLSETLPRLISNLHVPKAMRWGASEFTFVRPIRNLLCLFGTNAAASVVPFTVDGVTTCASTFGHRLFHLDHSEPVAVPTPGSYESQMEQAGIVIAFAKRRAALEAQLEALAAEVGGKPTHDEELLDTLALIVEFPRILRGAFPAEFMALPKEVLVTSLKEHQKAFCVEGPDGALLPYFLTAANRDDDPKGFIASGNEWVLKARLYDARFFFAEDQKTPLAERRGKLESLTFHRELGSYLEKTARITRLAEALAGKLGLDAAQAKAAAEVCKADLVTLMVGEFPELQGAMGGEYLKHENAPEAVWQAVKEHYLPIGAESAIPATKLGGLLAVADKLDTLAGCFAIGQIPSGSKDPLALRRAGAGIVRILWEQGWTLGVEALVDLGLEAVETRATKPLRETREALLAFFRDRVAYQLEVAGYAGPVRRSALPAGWMNLTDLKARCEALSAFAEDPRFASLAASAKRIGNILKEGPLSESPQGERENGPVDRSIEGKSPEGGFDAAVLQQDEEKELAMLLSKLEATLDQKALLAELASLAHPLEAFFSAVMVKCDDAPLRAARLSLLHRLRQAFLRVADFSGWQ